jgi:hypothetical protein
MGIAINCPLIADSEVIMKNKKLLAMLISFMMLITLMPTIALAELPQGVPGRLDAPTLEKAELIYLERPRETEKLAAFQLQVKLPQTALDLDAKRPTGGITSIEYFAKADNGEWVELEGGGYIDDLIGEASFKVPGKSNTFYVTAYAGEYGDLTAIDLNNHTYSFKVQLHYIYHIGNQDSGYVYSDFSNILTIGKNGVSVKTTDWSMASAWASSTLQRAVDLGLLPGALKGADMTKPITREEFCQLVMQLYEVSTSQLAEPAVHNPFSDTQNQQILKAYKLGITSGTSTDTFSPGAFISREQMSGMLFRTIKVIAPSADYNTTGKKTFHDHSHISSWAVEGIKYLSNKGIFAGDNKGDFLPKHIATREAAIAVILRTYDMIPKFIVSDNKIISKTSEHLSQTRLKLPEAFPNEIPFADDAVIQQIVDDSAARNFPSITLGYTSGKSLTQIKAIYKEFLKSSIDVVEQEMGDMYILTGHINNYELNVLYLNGQTHLTVTFE